MSATELVGDVTNIFEERPDKIVKLLPRGGELKGAALEKSLVEIFLEPKQLPADGGLLNPIGNAAHRTADTPVARDIIKQLQLMNVVHHDRQEKTLRRVACSINRKDAMVPMHVHNPDGGSLASHAAPVSGFLLGKTMRKCFHASMKKVNPRRPNAPPGYPIMPHNSR